MIKSFYKKPLHKHNTSLKHNKSNVIIFRIIKVVCLQFTRVWVNLPYFLRDSLLFLLREVSEVPNDFHFYNYGIKPSLVKDSIEHIIKHLIEHLITIN